MLRTFKSISIKKILYLSISMKQASLLLLIIVNVFFFSGYTPQASDDTQSEYYEDLDYVSSTSQLIDLTSFIQALDSLEAIGEPAFEFFRQSHIDQIKIRTLLRQSKETSLTVNKSIASILPRNIRSCVSEGEALFFSI